MKDCDFIPASYHDERNLRRAIRIRSLCLGAMFAIMGVWVVVHHERIAAAEAMLNEVTQQERQVQINRIKKGTMEIELAHLHDREHLIDQLANHANTLVVLSDLSRRLPETIVLTDMRLRCSSLDPYLKKTPDDGQNNNASQLPLSKKTIRLKNSGKKVAKQRGGDSAMGMQLTLSGVAASLPDIIRLQASLENSPLYADVSMQVNSSTTWAGRRAEPFVLVCKLVPESRSKS